MLPTPANVLLTGPPLAFRFSVTFIPGGNDGARNTIDTRFQRVSGLSATVETNSVAEGGQNLFTHRLPKRVSYGNLTLERGLVLDARDSPLRGEFEAALLNFQFAPCNVLISLLGDERDPLAAWLLHRAFPVRWTIGDLHAAEEKLLVETLELAYAHFQVMKV